MEQGLNTLYQYEVCGNFSTHVAKRSSQRAAGGQSSS